ncbi:ABC transporter [Thecamonas trahens ATCC 50062]|uniref:ABC transporter n=1 Tax=Thecamonas trahens ATCC 50062 TaxID=461836 RepID=A0A0L0DCD6_THETB|nr:ABC transporter [Thecamonas trahens ATCC 50062]KNC49900.1 ABC transporter [Thecamonas trahens ATCC 50062]|eukprot:XP_013757381.1 ABC transporter [Thecamonas trahens ATCC 50062]
MGRTLARALSRASTLATQYSVLSRKHALIYLRRYKASLGILLCPLAIVLLLLAFQGVSNYVLGQSEPYPDVIPLTALPHCTSHNGAPCKTVVYCPNNVPWVDRLMASVASRAGLDFNATFDGSVCPRRPPSQDLPSAIAAFEADNATLTEYMLAHPNQTQNVVLLYSAYVLGPEFGPDLPPEVGYILYYNATDHINYAATLKLALDAAELELRTGRSVDFDVSWQSFPRPKLRLAGYDVVAANGGVWFYVPPMVIFFLILTAVVGEKEDRLRVGMRMMGLSNSVYWATWLQTALVFVALSTAILMATGAACQFDFFLRASPPAVFLLFFLFGLASVALAFFASTLVQRVKTAQTVGYGIILVGFVFQSILCSGSGVLIDLLYSGSVKPWVLAVRYILQMYPPFNLAKAYYDIASRSSTSLNFAEGLMTRHEKLFTFDINIPAPIDSYHWLLVNAAVFGVLALYLDNVIPGEHGSPKPPYYFLLPSYWGLSLSCSRARSSGSLATAVVDPDLAIVEDSDVAAERAAIATAVNAPASFDALTAYDGLAVVGLSKTYAPALAALNPWSSSRVHALVSFCLRVRRGELFCILGPNGSGKTTLINVLTGLFTPSSGNAFVFGASVIDDVDSVRRAIGVCPQHDILYGELTPTEHLYLLASSKASPAKKLAMVELSSVAHHRVSTFSGGMKRRTSIAIACMGDPDLVVLDEPTTGLDVVTRTSVWTMIQGLKADRAVILTTHDMEEAQVLADRVGVMVYGRLRGLGSTLHLKAKYGGGYRIALSTSPADAPAVTAAIQDMAPGARLTAANAGSLSFKLPPDIVDDVMATVLARVEAYAAAQDSPVTEWGVSYADLEDVFIAIATLHGFEYEKLGREDDTSNELELELAPPLEASSQETSSPEPASRPDSRPSSLPSSRPFRALIRKNLSLQKRETFTNCCQIITPMFVMGILVLLQYIIRAELGSDLNAEKVVPSLPWPINGKYDLASFPLFNTSSIPSWLVNSTHRPANVSQSTCLEYFYVTAPPQLAPTIGSLPASGANATGFLGLIPQSNCTLVDTVPARVAVPYFEAKPSLRAMDYAVYAGLTHYNHLSLDTVKLPPVSYQVPDGFVAFSKLDGAEPHPSAPISLSYIGSVNNNPITRYHRANNFTRLDVGFIDKELLHKFSGAELIPLQGWLTLIDYLSSALTAAVGASTSLPGELALLGTPFLQAMPYYAKADLLVVLEIFGTMLYPVAITLQLPVYLYLLVLEKSLKLREMMKTMGLRTLPYIATNYGFFFGLYCLVIAFFWATGGLVQIRFFVQTGPSTLAAFFIGWGMALVGLAFFFASFVSSRQVAIVVGYIVALIGSLIGLVITAGIYGVFAFSVSTSMPWWYLIWPQFALCRGVYLMNLQCATRFACYGGLSSLTMQDELSHVIIALYASAVFFFAAGNYLDAVLPQEFGIRKPWWFPCARCVTAYRGASEHSQAIDPLATGLSINDGHSDEHEPLLAHASSQQYSLSLDAQAERDRIVAGRHAPDSPVALKGLSLVVEAGECLALLGENGAGKTTTISILTGVFPPTGGSATVAGYDVRTHIDLVHLETGLCPQFNILWETLTVSEHLLFYARLKGVPPRDEATHTARALLAFGLAPYASRKAHQLSGGMQRRLSVAISLIGDSTVVLLDEPSTGLDPVSRRALWDIIDRAKAGKAMVLTTHSLHEASLLASRIAIMASGSLHALGTQLELNARLDDGYRLYVAFDDNVADSVADGLLVQAAPVLGITDWGISQVGLHDVFHDVVVSARRAAREEDERVNHIV